MSRRIPALLLIAIISVTVACTNKRVNNPLANVGSKQPDKVLFDRALDAMKHNRFDVARITLQTLINTYPDSEFIARAKLAIADSWYAEGSSTSLAQAEIEYNDFKTFFPNMPEAAEAQLKIANIHYQQMEKPDRDYTHALRAEEEYRNLILQFPDSKLLPEAKQRLIEVQEVIAEREFRVGKFYFMKESYPAAIARLRSLVERYPLYSKVDDSLFMLGESYEAEVNVLRQRQLNEDVKARMIQKFTQDASAAYSRIITRYPLMPRAEDAKLRLEALKQPVPQPTKEALALNKAEQESRTDTPMVGRLMHNFQKHPDVASATKVGSPSLTDAKEVSASQVIQEMSRAAVAAPSAGNTLSAEAVGKNGAPPENADAPRSDTPPAAGLSAAQPDANELKPTAEPDPNELKPSTIAADPASQVPPPPQINELETPANGTQSADSSSTADPNDKSSFSSSKKKKKKGLHKLNPF